MEPDCTCQNCINCKIDNIYFLRNDVLFDFAKTKTDQEGIKNVDYPWYVYDNPLDPFVSPVLGLA